MTEGTQQRLGEIAIGVLQHSGDSFFRALLRTIHESLSADWVFVGELLPDGVTVRTVCLFHEGERAEDFEYCLPDSPCEQVAAAGVCIYPDRVAEQFPKDELLSEMGIRGYAGAALRDVDDKAIGLLVALSEQPFPDHEFAEAALGLFATRAASELERLIATRALERSERRFATMYESAPLAIALAQGGRFLTVNGAFATMFGHEMPEHLIGMSLLECISDAERERVTGFVTARARGEDVPTSYDTIGLRADGSTFPFHVEIAQIELEDGTGTLAFIEDITARVEAESRLRASEERFRMLYEQAPIPYQSLDEEGRLLHVNSAWLSALGYDESEVLGRSFADFVAPDQAPLFSERFPKFKERGFTRGAEFEMVRKDGSTLCVSIDGTIGRLADGSFVQTHCVVSDITEQKKSAVESEVRARISEAFALTMSEDVYARVVELLTEVTESPFGFFGFVDEEGDFVSASLTATIWDECDVPEKTTVFTHDSLEDTVFGLAVSHMKSGIVNGPRPVPMGHVPIERVMFAPIIHLERPIGMAAVANKNTDYRDEDLSLLEFAAGFIAPILHARLERDTYEAHLKTAVEALEEHRSHLEDLVNDRTAELQETNTRLEEATEAKSRFLAAMSHELRTPLNSILGFSGTLLQGLAGSLNDEQRRQLEMVNTSGHHLLALVDDVLDLSKIEAGAALLDLEDERLGDICDALIEIVSPMAETAGLKLYHSVECPELVIRTDRRKLQQILLNLLSNALKFTDEGEVHLECGEIDDRVRLAVSDTGVGIPEADLASVFDRFVQISSGDAPKPQGTGLGLALSQSLAELLGGRITAESTLGEGSRFVLELPLEPPALADVSPALADVPPAATEARPSDDS